MKSLLVCLLLCSTAATESYAEDRWLGGDKLMHVGACAGMTLTLGILSTQAYRAPREKWVSALVFAAGTSLLIGTLKEVDDSTHPNNHFSGRDMAANAVGTAVGLGLTYLFLRLME